MVVFFFIPMVWFSYTNRKMDLETRFLARAVALIILYVIYRYYLVQGGSTYGKGILYFMY